jgi:hypothetical protein
VDALELALAVFAEGVVPDGWANQGGIVIDRGAIGRGDGDDLDVILKFALEDLAELLQIEILGEGIPATHGSVYIEYSAHGILAGRGTIRSISGLMQGFGWRWVRAGEER